MTMARKLVVLWRLPAAAIAQDSIVLSFLPPAQEQELRQHYGDRVVSARQVSLHVRRLAVEAYQDVSVRIGVATNRKGETFRSTLAYDNGCSEWWYHPASFKDSEGCPILDRFIALFVIREVAARENVVAIHLSGAAAALVEVLRSRFTVSEEQTPPALRRVTLWWRGLGSRILYFLSTAWLAANARWWLPTARTKLDVVFTGFWDESLTTDAGPHRLKDKYFKEVPRLLEADLAVGWAVWLKPANRFPSAPVLARWLAPLRAAKNVQALQRLLSVGEIFCRSFSFRALASYTDWVQRGDLRPAFIWEKIDFEPLFRDLLYYHFANAIIPHCCLLAEANKRAVLASRPQVTVTYLEHYLFGRAHYDGVRQAAVGARCVTMQHASINKEKTYYYLHPQIEYLGQPDGLAVPHPDHVCAMGALGESLFREFGYAKEQVTVTGCARFDHVAKLRASLAAKSTSGSPPHVLCAFSWHAVWRTK